MVYVPYKTFSLYSSYSVDECQRRLVEQIDIVRKLTFFADPEPKVRARFQGQVTNGGFSITPNLSYRNSFCPLIKGHFETVAGGACLKVRMVLQPSIAVVMALFSFTLLCLTLLAVLDKDGSGGLWPLLMFFVGYLMMVAGFNYGAAEAERALIALMA